MDDESFATVLQLAGVLALPIITALASGRGGAEGAGAAPPVRVWVGLHAMAGGAAGALAGAAGQIGGDIGSWALFGALIGTAQWVALRMRGPAPALWVPASIIGWAPFALANTPLTWAATGALAALLQALLCGRFLQGRIAWVVTSAFAWLMAGVAGTGAGLALVDAVGFPLAWVTGWTIVGLVGGVVTAAALRHVFGYAAAES
jgi:hypothetical protein